MELTYLAQHVLDVAANEQAIAYVKRDPNNDGAFASFHFCDWESLQTRSIPETAYLQIKFGAAGDYIAGHLSEAYACRAATLPDGGCVVLYADSTLQLFRPDGSPGARFPLEYQNTPACDIAFDGTELWFTAPQRDALVRFSLQQREISLRVGGNGVFSSPAGLTRHGQNLLVACAGSQEVKTLLLPVCEVGSAVSGFNLPPKKCFALFGRRFVWLGTGLYAFAPSSKPGREVGHV